MAVLDTPLFPESAWQEWLCRNETLKIQLELLLTQKAADSGSDIVLIYHTAMGFEESYYIA